MAVPVIDGCKLEDTAPLVSEAPRPAKVCAVQRSAIALVSIRGSSAGGDGRFQVGCQYVINLQAVVCVHPAVIMSCA